MAAQIEVARLLTWNAAIKHDRGKCRDLEAGVAKLFAIEMCEQGPPKASKCMAVMATQKISPLSSISLTRHC